MLCDKLNKMKFLIRKAMRPIKNQFLKLRKADLSRDAGATTKKPKFPHELFFSHIQAKEKSALLLLQHKFELLGSGLCDLGEPKRAYKINWKKDFRNGDMKDIKIPWELSRFQFLPILCKMFEVKKEDKYAVEAKNLILDWIHANPFCEGVNWKCAMEVAIRACNFAFAWFFLQSSKAWGDQSFRKIFLESLIAHGKFIYRNLEFGHGYNSNHLISDYTGLLFLGILFPEFKESKKWLSGAVAGLEKEMHSQVYEDGVSYEASVPYHRLVTELFGFSAFLCRENDVALSEDFWAKLEKMFEFAWHYTKPNALAPQIGDADDGRLFIFEDYYDWERRDHTHLFWLATALFPLNTKFIQNSQAKTSRGFNFGRIFVLRRDDFYCIVDCGTNGQNGNGGHAHNDTLSFELAIDGEDFIVDPGTYVYTADPFERKKFRSTAMHNTVMVDGEEMNRFKSYTLFGIKNDAKPLINKWDSDEFHDFLDAQHSGFERLSPPITHRRCFAFNKKNLTLEISDYLIQEKSAEREIEWNFHFACDVNLKISGNKLIAGKNRAGMTMTFPDFLRNGAEIIDGEVSPSYGVKKKAKTLRIKSKLIPDKNSPFAFTFRNSK